jgi:hypothetical protein
MNKGLDENKQAKKITKRISKPNKPNRSSLDKTKNNPLIKTTNLPKKPFSKIIRLDLLTETTKKSLKLDFSQESQLVEKLFLCKALISVKKKAFI